MGAGVVHAPGYEDLTELADVFAPLLDRADGLSD
jgi:hypothetical protein